MSSVERVKADVQGRVRNTDLPRTKPLLPLFEAIVNSIQAIEQTSRKDGQIQVTLIRDGKQLEIDLKDGPRAPIFGFTIRDNGRGFDDENYVSFLTADSRLKEHQGGKGVGRFLWLRAFDHVQICSTYKTGGDWRRRSFVFAPTVNGIEDHRDEVVEEGADNHQQMWTDVTLVNMLHNYRTYAPKLIETLVAKAVEHCLSHLLLNDQCPQIFVQEQEPNDGHICLNNVFEREIRPTVIRDHFSINGQSFEAIHVQLRNAEETHQIHYCAHNRQVRSEPLVLLNLTKKLLDERGQFVWATFVSGIYLDEHVNSERTDFLIEDHCEDGALDLGEITFQKIRSALTPSLELHLETYVGPIREEKFERIRKYTETESPKYRVLFKRHADQLDTIMPGLSDDKLEMELHRVYHAAERDIKDRARSLLTEDLKKLHDLTTYRSKYREFIEEANDLGKSNLAEYVVYRRLILDLLRNNLKSDINDRHVLEKDVHGIIFPLGSTSEDVPEDHQNLWLIDERLTYHAFLASDKRLGGVGGVGADGDKRPDVVMAFSHGQVVTEEGPYSSIVIVEFKRPGREQYSGTGPVSQIYDYIDRLKAGKVKRADGRPIPTNDGIAFFAYLICDITDKIKQFARDSDFTETPDREGYFCYHRGRGAYVEIISYSKMLRDAEARNRILFSRLGLSSRSPLK